MNGKTQVAVSFENDQVKVVEAVFRDGRLAVTQALTFTESDFALYLKRSKADEFLVTSDFPDLIYEIIAVPPAKEKFLRPLVEREIRKRFPAINDFSVAFHTLREQVRDGKKAFEVMVYVVEKERLQAIVSVFEEHEKKVSFLCPSILPIARLVHASLESQNEILLTIIDGGTSKTLLVSQNGHVLFLRVIQSRAFGIDEIDADNINMTVNYSRQTLRHEPDRIVIFGDEQASGIEEIKNRLIIPTVSMGLPASVILDSRSRPEEIYSAIALFLFASDLHWGSLVPPQHTAFYRRKAILKFGAVFFFCSSIALSGYSLKTMAEIPQLKAQMRDIRADMARRQSVWSEWVKARDEMNVYMPFISFSNTMESTTDVTSALHALSFLPVKDVKIQVLHFSNAAEGIKVDIKGELTADRYGDMSNIYQRLLKTLKDSGAIEVRSHSMEVKTRNFSIEGILKQEGTAPSDG